MPGIGLLALSLLIIPLTYFLHHIHSTFAVLGIYRQLGTQVPTLLQASFAFPFHPNTSLVPLGIRNLHGVEHLHIPNTINCEDLHYHPSSGLLFTACQAVDRTRVGWFPPLAHFDHPKEAWRGDGGLYVIDPATFTSKRLELEGWNDKGGDTAVPFVTHGIDVIDDPEDGGAVYIYAVNHLPNPDYYQYYNNGHAPNSKAKTTSQATEAPADNAGAKDASGPTAPHKAASQIEVFHHHLQSSTARYVRSIAHPLIRTPNDLLALAPDEVLVTNDHHYREGGIRTLEDLGWKRVCGWTDVIRVKVDLSARSHEGDQGHGNGHEGKQESDRSESGMGTAGDDAIGASRWEAVHRRIKSAQRGVEAEVVLTGLHNNNGLGRGPLNDPKTFFVVDAAGGRAYRARLGDSDDGSPVKIVDEAHLPNSLDNPSWFTDPLASSSASTGGGGVRDLSGLILPGLLTAAKTTGDLEQAGPSSVWMLIPPSGDLGIDGTMMDIWERRLLFSDDGGLLKTASGAVLLSETDIAGGSSKDGAEEGRYGWLFVTGFVSEAMLAVKVDLRGGE